MPAITPLEPALSAMEELDPETFRRAGPFPHIVLDGAFDQALVAQIHGLFATLRRLLAEEQRSRRRLQVEVGLAVLVRYPGPAREVVRS